MRQITLHYIRDFSIHDSYPHVSALSSISNSWRNSSPDDHKSSTSDMSGSRYRTGASPAAPSPPPPRRANAAIVMLARNSDLNDVASSMKQLEDRFNHRFNYPWVLLNDEPFTEEFIK